MEMGSTISSCPRHTHLAARGALSLQICSILSALSRFSSRLRFTTSQENQPFENWLQRGMVAVFFARPHWSAPSVMVNSADFLHRGATDFEFFGASLHIVPGCAAEKRAAVLLVGAPGFAQSTGRVLGFSAFDQAKPELLFTLIGPSTLSNFGQALGTEFS